MNDIILFPFADYWSFYVLFSLFIIGLLALDLGVFHKTAKEVSIREAAIWSVIWMALALLFNWLFYRYALWKLSAAPSFADLPGFDASAAAAAVGMEFLTGFIVEKTLAIDNIFVFVVVFAFFGIPPKYQYRVLFYGIIGALVFRAIFIALGAALMQYQWVILLFGAFLILTGIKMFFAPKATVDPSKNVLVRILKRWLPVTPQLEGERFFIRKEGVLHATPLLLALLFVEASDIIFAVDSVPAIFALTDEPLIVYTSNVFAILGLRAMYFLLAGFYHRFHMLKYGLGIVLVFVGLKMTWLNEAFGGKFPISWSLAIICGVIASSVAISLAFPPRGGNTNLTDH